MKTYNQLVENQDAKGLAKLLGDRYPFAVDNVDYEKLDDYTSTLLKILTNSFTEEFHINKDSYILDEIHKFMIYAKTCPSGKVTYIDVRPEILRFEVEISKRNFMQFDFHLGNGGYCVSLDYIPISQTNLKN
ncbi:hypothetical protein RZE82_04315 [Mollicutes bacterium LVI A0039]|nr:hypothetical protein RZE82_04315 [Mollicutes bacterium LVI A0039]